jgi:hypothetical protein
MLPVLCRTIAPANAAFREFKYGMNLRNRRAHTQARAAAWDFGNAKS